MPTSCNTHDYDGKLREKWFEMRPMLLEKYLPNCLSFDETIKEIEEWLDKKYFNVKRIGRARRSIRILTSQRRSNFDSRNDIDVEELLPILWNQVKNQQDIHDTFYEQLCDITGGSCSQGRSTRLFQFLFLFDLPTETPTTTSNSKEQQEKKDLSTEQDLTETTLHQNSESITDEKQRSKEESNSHQEQQSHLEEKQQLKEESNPHQEQQPQEDHQPHVQEKQQSTEESNPHQEQLQEDQQSQEEKHSHIEQKTEEKQQSLNNDESNDVQQINSSSSDKTE